MYTIFCENIGGAPSCGSNHRYKYGIRAGGTTIYPSRSKFKNLDNIYKKPAGAAEEEYTSYALTPHFMFYAACYHYGQIPDSSTHRIDAKIEFNSSREIVLDFSSTVFADTNYGCDGQHNIHLNGELLYENFGENVFYLSKTQPPKLPIVLDRNNIIWKYTDSTSLENTGIEYKIDKVLKTNLEPYYQINGTDSFSFDLNHIQTQTGSDKFIIGFDIFPYYKYIDIKAVPVNMNVVNANYIDFENFNFTFRT